MLLVESLIHGLIEKDVLSVAEAVDIVDTATEVRIEIAAKLEGFTPRPRSSIKLLQAVSASLRVDLGDNPQGGNAT